MRPIVARAMKTTGFLVELITNTNRCRLPSTPSARNPGLMGQIVHSVPQDSPTVAVHHDILMQLLALFEFKDTFSEHYVKAYPRMYLKLLW